MEMIYKCRMPQKDVEDVWFDDLEAARKWADENKVIGCTVAKADGTTVYSPLREGISDLMYHAKQVCDYFRDNEFNYGDAPINPAMNDDARLASCDRLVGCCLYRWGWVDQPHRQGLRVACMRFADWCEEHGFTRIERVEDLEPGDICFQRWDHNHQPAHTYLYAGKGPEEGMHYRYDGGSVTRLRSTQPSCEPIYMFLFAYRPTAPADPVTPRCAFTYDGVPFEELEMTREEGETGIVYTLKDGVQLECCISRHPEQRILRWNTRWHNPTDHESGRIAGYWDWDVEMPFPAGEGADTLVYAAKAVTDAREAGVPVPVELAAGEEHRFAGEKGRLCLDINRGQDGWLLGVDKAEDRTVLLESREDHVRVRIGGGEEAFCLKSGETRETEDVTVAGYLRGREQGHNRWRTYMGKMQAEDESLRQDAVLLAGDMKPEVLQNRIQCAAEWAPGCRVDVENIGEDIYAWRSAFAPELTIGGQKPEKPEGDDKNKRRIWEYLSVRALMDKDYYPLIPASREDTGWSVSQYHDYENHRGMILAFRRGSSPFTVVHVMPRDLELYAHYEFVDMDSGKRFLVDGRDATWNGMDLTIEGQRQSLLLTYRALLPGFPY